MEDQALPSNHSTQIQQPTTETSIPCVVCGVLSRGLIYGANACEACKAFFKRNAKQGLVSEKVLNIAFASIDFLWFVEGYIKMSFQWSL